MVDVLPTKQLNHSPTSYSTPTLLTIWGQRNTKSKNGWKEQQSLDSGYTIHWLSLDSTYCSLRFGFPSLKSKMYLLYELLWGLSKKESRFKYCLIPFTEGQFKKAENHVCLPGAGRTAEWGHWCLRLESPPTWGRWKALEIRCWLHNNVKVIDSTPAAHQKLVKMVDFVRHIWP